MRCCDKDCGYKERDGGDEIGDFYFCKYVGIAMDRSYEECLIDKYEKEGE